MEYSEKIAKKYLGKVQGLMAEFYNEQFTDEDRKEIEDVIKNRLMAEGVPINVHTLKAFREGGTMMIAAVQQNDDMAMFLNMSVNSMVQERESKTKKAATEAVQKLEESSSEEEGSKKE
jgi:hypothetical protein